MITAAEPRIQRHDIAEGVTHLGDDQLLALLHHPRRRNSDAIIRMRDLLDHRDGILGIAGMDPVALNRAGLRPSIAQAVAAAFELGRRIARAQRRSRPTCTTPEEVVALMAPELLARSTEELWLLPLDARSQLIGDGHMISRGSAISTDVSPSAIMRHALTAGATSCVLIHQHPSGNPEPSAADRAATARIAAAGRAVEITLADHIVLGDGGRFISLRRSDPVLFR